jgi:hypothetical protein
VAVHCSERVRFDLVPTTQYHADSRLSATGSLHSLLPNAQTGDEASLEVDMNVSTTRDGVRWGVVSTSATRDGVRWGVAGSSAREGVRWGLDGVRWG